MNVTDKIQITNEDNIELMARYPDKYFDLAIVDPPYGINVGKMAYTQEDNRPCKQKNGTILRVKKLNYNHKDWDNKPAGSEYFNELFRISKNQIVWGFNYMDFKFNGGVIVWDKCVPAGVSFSDCELAFCSMQNRVTKFTYMWTGFSQAKSHNEPNIQQGNKKLNEKRIHPTQKPVALYKWLLEKYAKQGDKILDTHLGSGSIAIACHDYGFDLTACELDKEYYDKSIQRINNHISQQKLF